MSFCYCSPILTLRGLKVERASRLLENSTQSVSGRAWEPDTGALSTGMSCLFSFERLREEMLKREKSNQPINHHMPGKDDIWLLNFRV